MDIQQIQYFLEVVHSGSFSEAAEKLYTSQSSVSKNIKNLEKELGIQLFDRSTRKIELTEAGERILAESHALLASYDKILQEVAICQKKQRDSLSIISIPVMAQYNITGLLSDFQDKYSNIQLDINEMEGVQILSALENGNNDFAFMRREHLTDDKEYDCIPIFEDKLAVVLPSSHPLSTCSSISLADLKNENFLLLNKGTLLYDQILSQCEKHLFTPNITYTGTRMENIIELVGKNRGISLMMQHAAEYVRNEHTVVIPLEDQVTSTIVLVRSRKKKLTNAGKLFWDYMK